VEQEPSVTTDGSDAELITRVRAGDRSAFGTLYARHSQAATNLARQFARTPAEVDDLVSESFARVLDALLGGRGPATAFRAYLFTTLRNTAFDRTRKDAKLQFTDDVSVHETPEVPDDPVVLELENTLVAKAFAALPERWQVVLWHTQVERQSPAEVGVLLGMSANAVTSLAFRAREGLREAYLRAHLADTAAERCRTTVDRLGAWVRGGLSKREQAQVDAHLDECDRCRALAAELTEINSGLRGLLAPLLLGGAAAGYLATTSTGVAVPLVAAGGGAAAVGAGAAAGSGSSGGVLSFLARPWTLAAGGAGVAAAAAIAIVIAVTGNSAPLAEPPPVAPVTQPSVTGAARTTPPSTSAPATSDSASAPAPVVPPVTSPTSPRVSPTTGRTPPPTSSAGAPAVVRTTVGTAPGTVSGTAPERSTTSPLTTSSSTAPTSTPAAPATLSAPQLRSTSLAATAGAPSTVSFSVTNSGATDSDPQTVAVSTPDGVSLAGGSGSVTPQAPALRAFSVLLPAAVAAPGAGSVACRAEACT
jgi:RNA polymerase sigma factor (sigma-70 family)